MISILAITGYSFQQNQEKLAFKLNDSDGSILDFYRQYSSFTDPEEYEYLYKKLPGSLPEFCSLIKSQFIHLIAELPIYSEQIPKERWDESLKYPTVKSVLEGLLSYDSRGFDLPPINVTLLEREYLVLEPSPETGSFKNIVFWPCTLINLSTNCCGVKSPRGY